jgi:8-oxo-dGTP diphosphatase
MAPYNYPYPRPALTVDVIIFALRDNHLHVLLVERKEPPFAGQWALPGGFVEMDESLEEAAARELYEETGVQEAYLEQLYTFGGLDRDPRGRVITVAYFALVPADVAIDIQAGSDATRVSWFPADEPPELAFENTPPCRVLRSFEPAFAGWVPSRRSALALAYRVTRDS